MSNPDIDLNDPKNMLQFVGDPIDKFNLFIRKWCPDYAHLMDSDDNDGEEIRDMLRDMLTGLKEQPETITLNKYEAVSLQKLFMKLNDGEVKNLNTGDWYSDIPFKIKQKFGELE